jgi:hypothetical protein
VVRKLSLPSGLSAFSRTVTVPKLVSLTLVCAMLLKVLAKSKAPMGSNGKDGACWVAMRELLR